MHYRFSVYVFILVAGLLGPKPAQAFDFIGLFGGNDTIVINEKGFTPRAMKVAPGSDIDFKNQSTQSLRLVEEQLKISTPPISPGGHAVITFTRLGKYQIYCGKLCKKPFTVTVSLRKDD
jgi:plastocyanin